MSTWSPGSVDPLRKASWQLELPLLGIQGMSRVSRDWGQDVPLLNFFTRTIGVVEHHVVRVDEIHRQKPRLTLGCEISPPTAQPVRRHRGDDAVVQVAALGVPDNIADPEVVRESVSLHLLGEDLFRRRKIVGRLKFFGEMPLALVGRVVAGLAQKMADRLDVGRHAVDPGKVGVVEHARVLNVLPGVKNRAGRRADAGIDPVVFECHALSCQALVRRQTKILRQFAWTKVALLIRENEQDIVRSAGGLSRLAADSTLRSRSNIVGEPTAECCGHGARRHGFKKIPSSRVDGTLLRVFHLQPPYRVKWMRGSAGHFPSQIPALTPSVE